MRLFIANITHQRQVIYYRLDFINEGNPAQRVSGLKQVAIEPGKQVTVGGDLTLDQAQMIMDQLTPCGGVGVEELNRLPQHRLAYAMSVDKEIPIRVIRMLGEHNDTVLTRQGEIRREQAAIAAHPVVDRQIDNLKKLDIEMLEVPPEMGDPDPVGKPLDFGAHVDPHARESGRSQPSSLSTRRSKRGRR